MIYEEAILVERKEGWGCHGIDVKTGRFKTLRKWHYFKNGVSLCGKYKEPPHSVLLGGGLFSNEICKECLKKLKQVK